MSHVVGLERAVAGFFILEQLGLAGWNVTVTSNGAGGSRVRARLGDELVEHEGETAADVALTVFEEARARSRRLPRGH